MGIVINATLDFAFAAWIRESRFGEVLGWFQRQCVKDWVGRGVVCVLVTRGKGSMHVLVVSSGREALLLLIIATAPSICSPNTIIATGYPSTVNPIIPLRGR